LSVAHSGVVSTPIEPSEVLARVGSREDGATLLFLGVVRDHADGRAVSGMRYDAYREMAEVVLGEVAAEAVQRLGTDRVAVVHRIGELKVGDVSVAVAVSSPHRAESYDVSRYVIEEIKRRLPVWKKELYADGEARWVDGAVPPGTGSDAEVAARAMDPASQREKGE
jgi:molybdopterin synthase catalytic subunit